MPNIRNVQDFEYFIELYEDVDIVVSTTVNQGGIINTDSNGNLLGSVIHSGSNYITNGVKTISGNMILYDETGNFVYIDDDFDENDIDKHFLIKPTKTLRYKINADRVLDATVSGSKLLTDLTNKTPFKVFLNGRIIEDTEYTYDNTGITISSPFDSNISNISDDIIIYTYVSVQTIPSGTLTLTYKSPHTLVPVLADLLDDSYTDTYSDLICSFDGFDVAVDKTNNPINNIYQYISKDKEVNRNSKVNVTLYDNLAQLNLRDTIKDQVNFRILMWDYLNTQLIMYSNCIWKTGSSTNYNKTKIDRNFNIEFEDEIIITYSGASSVYGESLYELGWYGDSNTEIKVYGT